MLNKRIKSYRSILNYFIIQETLGLLFLILTSGIYQFFIVLFKIGVAPFHFWLFNVTNGILNYSLIWFLTFQKLPFLLILLQLFYFGSYLFLIIGLLFCYFQLFSIKNYKNIIIISSTESFSWIVLGLIISFFNSMFLFLYYFVFILILISKFNLMNYNLVNWETSLVFLNIPYSVSFFVKIFSIGEITKNRGLMIILLLFLMFLSVISFSYWFINLRIKNELFNINNKILFPFLSLIFFITLV